MMIWSCFGIVCCVWMGVLLWKKGWWVGVSSCSGCVLRVWWLRMVGCGCL